MSATLKMKVLGLSDGETSASPSSLDLAKGVLKRDGLEKSVSLDDWPLLVFLKGFGCSQIEFFTHEIGIIERWSERLLTYEQIYLADPDSLKANECHWDETEPVSGKFLIQCKFLSPEKSRDTFRSHSSVPPMEAPLGISASAKESLLQEIQLEQPQETLSRFASILQEYKQNAQTRDPVIWSLLVGDIICICLENRQMERAIQLAAEHQANLNAYWNDQERVARLLAAYDPKASDVQGWLKIFETLPTPKLVQLLEVLLGSESGPALLKLVSSRAQANHDELIDICFRAEPLLQKLLLQWLHPFWKPFHFGRVLNALQTHIQASQSDELLKLWLLALLRSSPSNALDELVVYFKPKIPFWRGGSKWKRFRKIVVNSLAEHPSAEVYEFLKRIRKYIEGELADQVERILQNYREVRS